jgi:hypothetical protein
MRPPYQDLVFQGGILPANPFQGVPRAQKFLTTPMTNGIQLALFVAYLPEISKKIQRAC